ncbi:MutS-related protein [Mangrovihabitans endophyticus]|uniref:DNA mismatch repair protein MutS n=1 Tax=Mangrovihabitans endophyticus TaxID=1751298 RepID=A0A8J3BVB6_9ACTN|nr:DNA mismatch repair protein MutS [Mangrovihabitans endophyticus]GGK79843.1 DNA mismatch repair protein MutS [Mangrovihabitans endophyticus]
MTTAAGFASILFDDPADRAGIDARHEPDVFGDLNLDQVVAAVTRGRETYNLAPYFYTPVHERTVGYRHDVLRELQQPDVRGAVTEFAKQMRAVRRHLEQVKALYYQRQKQLWFLDAIHLYSQAVTGLTDALGELKLRSHGLKGLHAFLQSYAAGPEFSDRATEAGRLREQLTTIRYTIDIRGDRIRVGRYADEPDYSREVTDTFARFRQGEVKDYRASFQDLADLNRVEATVLQYVANLHPDIFDAVAAFVSRHGGFLDPVITDFDREVQFYLAWIDYVGLLGTHGLKSCLPVVSTASKQTRVRQAFDVALADKLTQNDRPVVCNDVDLDGDERILVISGPNQGGKTTYARMFGQLHYLARLGCPVPGARAELFLPDGLYTHFERQEVATDLHGKLEDDLIRVHRILEHATGDSVVIMNEIFTSTTLEDALFLGERIMDRLLELGCLGVYVTFVEELSRMGEATVSMVSTVDEHDAAKRTFNVVRRDANGLSYALSIAQKYGLTYDTLKERIA